MLLLLLGAVGVKSQAHHLLLTPVHTAGGALAALEGQPVQRVLGCTVQAQMCRRLMNLGPRQCHKMGLCMLLAGMDKGLIGSAV
jgi:hypothetical protein